MSVNLMKATLLFLLTAITIAAWQEEIPANWTRLITIQAEAKTNKLNGRPWDANDVSIMPPLPHMLGAVFFPVTAPAPDMLICIADEAGAKRCYHHTKRNALGVPYSLCPNSYSCTLESVPVPDNYLGVLVADLDYFNANDFVMAQIVYQGPKDAKRIYQVEKHLHELAQEWHVTDAPAQFLATEMATCTLKDPCVPRGGAGWLGYAESKTEECGEDIKFTLRGKDPGQSLPSLALEAADVRSDCGGDLEFRWEFGDGKTAITASTTVTHVYEDPGTYTVSATPRCRRQFTVCEAPKSTKQFQVK